MTIPLPRPAIFAHRGSSAYAPENTLAAFELAVAQNADAIELDTKLSKDGQVVVIHDQTVDRTTDGRGLVGELDLEDLKKLDAGSRYDRAFSGEQIPTLAEVFEALRGRIYINVELTNYKSPQDSLPQKVVDLIREFGLQNQVLISSFNPVALRRFHKHMPETPLGLLAISGIAGFWARSMLGWWLPHQALHPEVRDTSRFLIRCRQRLGYRVHTYTVNQPEDMLRFYGWGIDGIFSDDPPLAQKALAQFREEANTPK